MFHIYNITTATNQMSHHDIESDLELPTNSDLMPKPVINGITTLLF